MKSESLNPGNKLDNQNNKVGNISRRMMLPKTGGYEGLLFNFLSIGSGVVDRLEDLERKKLFTKGICNVTI